MNLKQTILDILKSADGYISGEKISAQLNISRTAVWKVINQLKEEGYQIESVSRRGYRLVEGPADILSESEIASILKTQWAGRKLYCFDTTGSTNTDAKRLGEEGEPHGTVVTADIQTAGKGRRGRSWQTLSGTALAFTLLLRPDFAPDKASMITLVMALAVAEAISEVTGLEAGIKWPNDIVVNGKKVVGILTELSVTPEMNETQFLVAGVGVNVNQDSAEEFPEEIRNTATSLKMEAGCSFARAVLLERILAWFEEVYDAFEQTLDLSGLKERYENRLVGRDAVVRVLDPAGEYNGISRGINETGELIVEKEDGSGTVLVYAGEVSVRGLYGYT